MATTTIRNTERSLARIEAMCQETSGMALLPQFAEAVNQTVPYEAAFWSASDPMTTIPTSPALVENHPPESCVPFWEVEYSSDDQLRFDALARAPRPYGTLHELTGGQLSASPRFVDLQRPFGLGDEFRIVMRSSASSWGIASLSRSIGDRPFSQDEQEFLAAATVHLGAAMRRLALQRSFTITPAFDTPGIATLDSEGNVISSNDEFLRWVEEIPTFLLKDGVSSRLVPTEILSLIGRAQAKNDGDIARSARARMRGSSGRWLALHATSMKAGGSHGLVALVIEPAPESEISAIMVEAFGLSPREREVASYVARGLDTQEIARHLFLSPHTVRDYLKTIFEKIGVSSRGEMVARLFTTLWHEEPAELMHVVR